MDDLVLAIWNALGVLWRVAIIAGPIVFLVWAARHVRAFDEKRVEREIADIQERHERVTTANTWQGPLQ